MARSKFVLVVLLRALAASSAVAQLAPDADRAAATVEVTERTAEAHLVVPVVPLRSNRATEDFVAEVVEVVIDQAGRVASATIVSGPDDVYSGALAQAQHWTFRPFEKDGSPVAVQARIAIPVLPREQLPAAHHPFPMVGDPRSVRITRRDTACLGTCPVFEIAIDGEGDVTYDGEDFVAVTGRHHDHVPPDAIARLIQLFRRADFFSLRDEYAVHAFDLPSCIISISVGDQRKSLVDYGGVMVGMPAVVSEIEKNILNVSGAEKWTNGTADTVPSLKRERWDFNSQAAADTLARLVASGSVEAVRAMLAEGVPVNVTYAIPGRPALPLLVIAAARHDPDLVQLLIDAGAGRKADELSQALLVAARAGDATLARRLIAMGADPNARSDHNGLGRWTALMEAAASTASDGDPDRTIDVLTEAGADVDARDELGNTAMHRAASVEAVEALI